MRRTSKSSWAEEWNLPEDLRAFLQKRGQLSCDWKQAQTGRLKLRALDQLRIGSVYAAARGTIDPNRRREGVYRVPAISLIARCERYDPEHLLTFLPFERKFATFDGDHAVVTLFTQATWTDIAKDPLPYVNANWESKPSVASSRRMKWWLWYEFFEDAFE